MVAGWSQTDVARMLYLSRSEVAHIESGRSKLSNENCQEILYRYDYEMNSDPANKEIMKCALDTLVYEDGDIEGDALHTIMVSHRRTIGSSKGMKKIREEMLSKIGEIIFNGRVNE